MPTGPDFYHHYAPRPEHDVRLLLPGFETGERAEAWRLKRIELLRKGGKASRRLADKLAACTTGAWCLSPACPPCARAYRTWLGGEVLRLLAPLPDKRLRFTTLVMTTRRVAKGRLHELDTAAAVATLKRQLERAPLPDLVLVGGLDLDLEVDRLGDSDDEWQPHAHLITSGGSDDGLKAALKPHYPATEPVSRPLRVDRVGDRARQLTYCCKNFFQRRVRGVTGKRPLSDGEWREALRFLDRHGFGELTILKGVRRHGGELRSVTRAVADKTGEKANRGPESGSWGQGSASRREVGRDTVRDARCRECGRGKTAVCACARCAPPPKDHHDRTTAMTSRTSPTSNVSLPVPKLIATGKDPWTKEGFDLFAGVDRDGKRKKVLVPVSATIDGERGVLKVLHAAGVRFPAVRAQQAAFVAAMQDQTTTAKIMVASRPGRIGSVYVMPHKAYGDERGEVRRHFPAGAPGAGLKPRGSLDEYRSGVAELARGNHAVMFGIMAAAAAPLPDLLGCEVGGFQFVAPSSRAKSSAAIPAAAFYGMEHGVVLRTWKNTANKVDELIEGYNGLLLVLDETKLAGKNDRERAEVIEDVAYSSVTGHRKGRLGEPQRGRASYVILLSTSEKGSREIARAGRVGLDDGQLVRLTDIFLPDTPELGILQDLHGAKDLATFAKRLRRSARRTRGIAGDAYLERLAADVRADRAGLVRRLEAWIAEYLGGLENHDLVDERIAQRFALFYAAGRLAAHYGVLPYSKAEILAAVRYCHRHAETEADPTLPMGRQRMSDGQLLCVVAERVKRLRPDLVHLRTGAVVPAAVVAAAPGFVREGKHGTELLFTPAKFLELVCAGLDEQAVIAMLKAMRLIVMHRDGKSRVTRDLPEPLGRMRVVCVKAAIEQFATDEDA
ncbi:MAG: DUF927 domain-containing protein [Geminicoccaceae bacterium]